MDRRESLYENVNMAPVKKPPHRLRPTFLRQWRDYRGLTQEQAAERINVSRTLLSKIEGGKSPYVQQFLEKAAEAYQCEPWDLLNVNPMKEGSVVDITARLRHASPAEREQALRVLDAVLPRTG